MPLSVYLYDQLIGHLREPKTRGARLTLQFSTNHDFGYGSRLMSESVPLISGESQNVEVTNFFDNLLPEGAGREQYAQLLNVDKNDIYSILKYAGGDVAGALSIRDTDDEFRTQPSFIPLNPLAISRMLQGRPVPDLSEYEGRASLGGVQRKVALSLAYTGGSWQLAYHSLPSTHIFKASSAEHPTMIYDEAYGLELARAVGLINYDSRIETFDQSDALIIERFDRETNSDGKTTRIHQEDTCQLLGISSILKYSTLNGRGTGTTLRKIAEHLHDASGEKETLHDLLRMTVFHAAIGNVDAHAKNMGVLKYQNGSIVMAPAYDIVPIAHRKDFTELALHIGTAKSIQEVSFSDLKSEARDWGIKSVEADTIIKEVLAAVIDKAPEVTPHEKSHHEMVKWIQDNSKRLDSGHSATSLPRIQSIKNTRKQEKCNQIVKKTGKLCLLDKNHNGNHRSVLRREL